MRILILPAFSLLLIGFLVPLFGLFWSGVFLSNTLIITDAYLRYVIQFTYWQAFLSASFSLVLGFLGAFLVEEIKIRGGKILFRFCLLCSALPALIVSLGILGSWGRMLSPFGWIGILLGHVFLNFSIPMRLIGMSLRERDRQSEILALSLGAKRHQVFLRITLAAILPSLVSSWILAFLYSSTSLFIVMFLGGGPRFTTLEVALYEAVKWNLDAGKAVQIAFVQAFFGGALFYFYLIFQKRKKMEGKAGSEMSVFSCRGKGVKLGLEILWWMILVCLVCFPLASLLKDGLAGIETFSKTTLLTDLISSLAIAFAVGVTSLLFLYPVLHYNYHVRSEQERSLAVWLLSAPQFVSPLVVALALTLFFPFLKGSSAGSFLAVIFAQTIFVFPLIHIPLREGFLRLSQEKIAIAQSLGASRLIRFLKVELPSMKKPIVFSFLLAVSFSLGEVVTLLIFSPTGVKTVALNIFQSMSRYRFQEAHLSTLILVVCISSVLGLAGYWENDDG